MLDAALFDAAHEVLKEGLAKCDEVSTHTAWSRAEGKSLKSLSYRCQLIEVAFLWEVTKETIHLPMGCFQGETSTLT